MNSKVSGFLFTFVKYDATNYICKVMMIGFVFRINQWNWFSLLYHFAYNINLVSVFNEHAK